MTRFPRQVDDKSTCRFPVVWWVERVVDTSLCLPRPLSTYFLPLLVTASLPGEGTQKLCSAAAKKAEEVTLSVTHLDSWWLGILRREKQTDGAKRKENNGGREKKQTNSNDRGGKWGSKRKEMKRKKFLVNLSVFSHLKCHFFKKLLPQSFKHILTGLDHVWCSLRCVLQTTTEKWSCSISYYSRKLQHL